LDKSQLAFEQEEMLLNIERAMLLRDQMNQGKPSLLLDLLNLNLAINLGYSLPFLQV